MLGHFFRWMCLSRLRIRKHSENPVHGVRKTQERLKKENLLGRKQNAGVLVTPVAWYAHFTSVVKLSKEAIIIKNWALTSTQELKVSEIVPFFSRGNSSSNYTRCLSSLDEMFPNSWSRRYGPVGRPARAYDLPPLDFFLRKFVKGEVLRTFPSTLTQFERRIPTAIRTVSQKGFDNVWTNLENQLYADIREFCGRIVHRWHLIRTELVAF